MTAPIVWRDDRTPLTNWEVAMIAHGMSNGDRDFIRPHRPAGQLWERLAEYTENHS